MIVLFAFLAGMAFLIAVAACIAAQREKERAEQAEMALLASHATLSEDVARLAAGCAEQAALVVRLAQQDADLNRLISAVAAASAPPAFPADQSKVFISVPGPRTRQ